MGLFGKSKGSDPKEQVNFYRFPQFVLTQIAR